MTEPFDVLCDFLRRNSGLVVEPSKRYLVESRILPIVRREKLASLDELVRLIERGKSPQLAKDVIQAMTINETYFFRDKMPFDIFRDVVLPKLLKARSAERKLRIWSAACSTGQEPYSLAMLLDEAAAKLSGWTIEIVATDLSEAVLEKARKGTYSQFEVQRGLPTTYLLRHFNQIGDSWQLNEALRSRVTFRSLNLLSDFSALGRFDVIFCRNVLIYFDTTRKEDVLKRMSRILSPEGFLLLGASESLIGLNTDLSSHPDHRCLHMRRTDASTPATAAPKPAWKPTVLPEPPSTAPTRLTTSSPAPARVRTSR